MALRAKSAVFAATDGVLTVLRRGDAWAARGADWSSRDAYDAVATVPFASSQLRYVDAAVLGDSASDIARKVRAQLPPGVTSTDCVAIGGVVYDVTKLDQDGRLSWLYLAQLTADGTCDLVMTETRYDSLGLSTQADAPTTVLVRKVVQTDDGGTPAVHVTVRARDYAGERVLVRGDGAGRQRYSVRSATWSGDWATLTCMEGGADVGRT